MLLYGGEKCEGVCSLRHKMASLSLLFLLQFVNNDLVIGMKCHFKWGEANNGNTFSQLLINQAPNSDVFHRLSVLINHHRCPTSH